MMAKSTCYVDKLGVLSLENLRFEVENLMFEKNLYNFLSRFSKRILMDFVKVFFALKTLIFLAVGLQIRQNKDMILHVNRCFLFINS